MESLFPHFYRFFTETPICNTPVIQMALEKIVAKTFFKLKEKEKKDQFFSRIKVILEEYSTPS